MKRLVGMEIAIGLVICIAGIVNADMLVHLTAPEGSGSTTVNSGTSGGVGTLGSGVTFSTDEPAQENGGTNGYSLNFDGAANSRVDFGTDFTGLNVYQSRLVIAAWVKISDFSHSHSVIMASSASSGLPDGFVLNVLNNQRLNITYKPASQSVLYADSGLALVTAGEWTHIAAKIDTVADTISLYINGEKLYVKDVAGSNQIAMTSTTQFTLNRTPGVDTSLFEGLADDIRIYNNDMTDAEIAALAVPEPATMALLGIGGLLISMKRRRD